MGFFGILKRIRELWAEHTIAVLLLVVLGFGIFWNPWVGVIFTLVCTALFVWYLVTLWKGDV